MRLIDALKRIKEECNNYNCDKCPLSIDGCCIFADFCPCDLPLEDIDLKERE